MEDDFNFNVLNDSNLEKSYKSMIYSGNIDRIFLNQGVCSILKIRGEFPVGFSINKLFWVDDSS